MTLTQNRYRFRSILLLLFLAILPGVIHADSKSMDSERSTQDLLQSYVDDYRLDPSATQSITFGIRVKDEGDWHVVVTGRAEGQKEASVELKQGFPAEPTLYFVLDRPTLEKIDRGELNSLTAMGKAFESDFAPMDMDAMEGFQAGPETMQAFLPLIFHFWNRGLPEVVPFGPTHTRQLHGGNAVLFYYQPGVRYGWFEIANGQHVNKDEKMQTNPFPTIMVMTRGKCQTKIEGNERTIREGEMIFIPKGTSHEFWNPNLESAEGIILMFGEGA